MEILDMFINKKKQDICMKVTYFPWNDSFESKIS